MPLGPSTLGRGYCKVLLVKFRLFYLQAVWPSLCQPVGRASRVIYWEKTQARKPVPGRKEKQAPLHGRIFPRWLCSLQVYEVPVAGQALCWEGPEEHSSSPVHGPAPLPPPRAPHRPTLRSLYLLTWGWWACVLPSGSGEAPGRVAKAGLSWSLSHYPVCISQTQTLGRCGLEEPFSLIYPEHLNPLSLGSDLFP